MGAENGRAYPDYFVRYYCGSRDPSHTPFENVHEAMNEGEPLEGAQQGIEMRNGVASTWEFAGDDDWIAYADHQQVELETAFQSYRTTPSSSDAVRIYAGGWAYDVDFAAMVLTDIGHRNHRRRPERRRPNDDPM